MNLGYDFEFQNKKLKITYEKLESIKKKVLSRDKQLSVDGFSIYITSYKENLKPLIKFLTPFYNYIYKIDVPIATIKTNDLKSKEIVTFDNSEIINCEEFKDNKFLTLKLDYQNTTLIMNEEEIKQHSEELISTFCNFNPDYRKDRYSIRSKLH